MSTAYVLTASLWQVSYFNVVKDRRHCLVEHISWRVDMYGLPLQRFVRKSAAPLTGGQSNVYQLLSARSIVCRLSSVGATLLSLLPGPRWKLLALETWMMFFFSISTRPFLQHVNRNHQRWIYKIRCHIVQRQENAKWIVACGLWVKSNPHGQMKRWDDFMYLFIDRYCSYIKWICLKKTSIV